MSKSKKNTIDPEGMIKNFGADAVRLFILSDSPPEKDVQWSNQGMNASFRFIQKIWSLHLKVKDKLNKETIKDIDNNSNTLVLEFTNSLIDKVSKNLENFNYNVIIANFHEAYNFFNNQVDNQIGKETLLDCYTKVLLTMYPFIPHIISETLEDLKFKKEKSWPKVEVKFLEKSEIELVIQINGKKRSSIKVKKDENEKLIIEKAKKDEKILKFLNNQPISKYIFVKNRLINFIIKQ